MLINVHDKNKLVRIVNQVIDDSGWNPKEAADILKVTLSDVSSIKRLKAENFSLDRLLVLLIRVSCKLTIVINSEESTKQTKPFEFATSAS